MILNPYSTYTGFCCYEGTGIPEELKVYKQWCVWRLEQIPSDKKPRKVPYSPITRKRVGPTEKYRETWGTFEEACAALASGKYAALASGKYAGLMFALTTQDPFIAIDFDHCVKDNTIEPWVNRWINKLGSFTEYSPSGTGAHILIRGNKPGTRCKKNCPEYDIEMYDHDRFITVTGHVIDDMKKLHQNQDSLIELYNERLASNDALKPVVQQKPVEPLAIDDTALLKKIRSSKQGSKFDGLMSGSTAGYGSDDNKGVSEADAALCMILAFWTQKDPYRIDRIFRTSGLMRPKWDEPRGNKTYGAITIENAIRKTGDVYNPQPKTQTSNVISMSRDRMRKVTTPDTGFESNNFIFPDPPPWPEIGSRHYIDRRTGGLYLGKEWSDARDLIAMRPIWIHSVAKDEFNERFRVIKFYDEDFIQKTACFPANWFSKAKDGNIWSSLMSQGMIMNSGKEKYVSRYLDSLTSVCSNRSWAASKLGWFDPPTNEENTIPVFVLPTQIIGNVFDNKEVFFQSLEEINSKTISSRGSLRDWQTQLANKATNNYLMMFAISAGIAGSMTKLANIPSGGFHFWGLARTGKTALLQLATSVWGNASDPQTYSHKTSIRKWNSTSNGLEATAQLHNDIVLCLDEIGELEPSDLSKLIYTLTGGTPKGRMKDTGGLKNQAFWHIMLISSGEESTEQIMKSIGQTKRGGQTHRLPDIRIDSLTNGIVQTEEEDVADFIDQIKNNCSRYYGTAGPIFVGWMIQSMKDKGIQVFTNHLNINIKKFELILADGISPMPNEIKAVIKRMSAIGVAALYAAEAGIVNWTIDQITECMIFIRNLWLSDMEDNISELDKALSSLRGHLISNMANFEDLNDDQAKPPIRMMGYKNYDFIMVLPDAFDDFCGRYNKRQLTGELLKRSYLAPGEIYNGKPRLNKKIPVMANKKSKERPRCYWINKEFLND